ncbi:G-type lectin S-receptor-like serine/threonine-protein kinase LECRK1 [Selaginella moellendorffii]|uniref:G-type lectin S-receptor-like serine/threonine-protein kinase LECRK1 n=1 Tax=Selaginella moellendorffii TaxID=88036 RepID=UPI000D1CD761|nr:G-type lectin S-receptor-like serine/threonine-protein kinase LECRK1 [Selaginella moellendorffii]|eukprot:XP_024524781.1 G-type lectin S-receptor-like serine/threonine-protein kinase LECRK1 [Selaginella moellendorffii]
MAIQILLELFCPPKGIVLDAIAGFGSMVQAAKETSQAVFALEKEGAFEDILMRFCNSRVLADFLRGSTVTTGSPWRSPEGTFGFGFVMPESSSTRNFNLAIWYDIDPKKTVVWMAMANGQLVQVSENAKLELKAEGGLSVTDGSSSVPLWQTNPGQCCAESASLLENGNLVVLGKDKKVAWQSFDSPTNNLLPEQQLRTQGNPSLGYTRLISQSGAYQLVLNSGQVLLKNLKLEIPQKYWSIANPTLNSTMTCLDDETGEHVLNNNACQPDRSLKFPAVLNLSVLSFYDATGKSWASGSMSSQDYALDYDDANVPTKTCSCLPGFHRVDPNDESKGCDYDIPLGACQNSPISVKLVQVNRADYYFNDYNFDSTIKSLEELGSGGFRSVYRGNMAMKNITTVNQAEKQSRPR